MYTPSLWKKSLMLLVLAATFLGGNMLRAQSEAQAAEEEAPHLIHERSTQGQKPLQQESPSRLEHAMRPALAPADKNARMEASNPAELLLQKAKSISKRPHRNQEVPAGLMLVYIGAIIIAISLLVLILVFLATTAPIFLALRLFFLILFGTIGVIGLGFILAGIIYGISEGSKPNEAVDETKEEEKPAEEEKIKSEEIK